MTIERLDHYNIKAPAAELRKVKRFYIELLGLTEGWRPKLSGNGAWLYSNDHPVIHLSEVNTARPDKAANNCLDHVAFRCSSLENYEKKLNKMNLQPERFKIPELNMVQLFIKDPVGIRVELNFIEQAESQH